MLHQLEAGICAMNPVMPLLAPDGHELRLTLTTFDYAQLLHSIPGIHG